MPGTAEGSNVLFSNGWISNDDGTVYIYYASSDTRLHVAVSTLDKLVDYCLHTPEDSRNSSGAVRTINQIIDANLQSDPLINTTVY